MRLIKILILFFSYTLLAQQNSQLDILATKCEDLKNKGEYQKLITTASQGIKDSKSTFHLSKFNFYKAYGLEYDNNQYEKAIPYFESSLKFAQNGKHLNEETLALMRLNYLYYSTKQFSKRDSLIAYVKKVVDTTKSIYSQGILNGTLGEYYLDNSNIEKFIGYKLKAIEYRKQFPKNDAKNIVNIGISYSQIGQAYNKTKQYEKALEYYNEALPYLKSSNNALAFLYNDYIKSYTGLKKLNQIKFYSKKIEELITTNDSLHICVSSASKNLAEYYLNEKNTKEAEKLINKAIYYAKKSNDAEILMEVQITDGKILFANNRFNEAISVLTPALAISKDFDKNSYITITKLLSDSYAKIGNFEKAFQYEKLFSEANEYLLNEKAIQTLANAESKYQNKNKQEKIDLLSAENKLKNLEISTNRRNIVYLVIGSILILIISLLILKQSIQRKKLNYKLQKVNSELDLANKNKARLFGIINHDLRSPVAQIIQFLHLQKENPELLTEESKVRLENNIINGAENLLNTMEDLLLWSKGQMEHFAPQLKNIAIQSIFNDTQKHFSGEETVKINFENFDNIEIFTDENYLKTIIRNLTGNAIKALVDIENPAIVWKTWQNDSNKYLSISDNGKGADIEKFKALYDDNEVIGIKYGLGLHLIRDLAKAIDCEISVETKTDLGTTFTLIFGK